jgi:hypothetical protein
LTVSVSIDRGQSADQAIGLFIVFKRISKDLCGVNGGPSGTVVNLVAATGAGGGHEDFGGQFANVR